MNTIKGSPESGFAPPAPLFASSWIALFLQIRHNLETLRVVKEASLEGLETTEAEPHTNRPGNH